MSIAKTIDHTNIKKDATEEDIKKLCFEAKEYEFHGVCVNPEWIRTCSDDLKGSDVKVVVLIDHPMGLSFHEEREVEEKARHLQIMKEPAPGLLIKVSGNIRNYIQAKYMVDAGADQNK